MSVMPGQEGIRERGGGARASRHHDWPIRMNSLVMCGWPCIAMRKKNIKVIHIHLVIHPCGVLSCLGEGGECRKAEERGEVEKCTRPLNPSDDLSYAIAESTAGNDHRRGEAQNPQLWLLFNSTKGWRSDGTKEARRRSEKSVGAEVRCGSRAELGSGRKGGRAGLIPSHLVNARLATYKHDKQNVALRCNGWSTIAIAVCAWLHSPGDQA